jgi:hypothetical protein
MTECRRCGEYVFSSDRHTCPPLWLVWCPELGEDREGADDVYARDAEEAVKRWGRTRDAYGDYDIVRGAQYIVHVLQAGVADKQQTFRVHAESVPHYYATAIEERQTAAVDE